MVLINEIKNMINNKIKKMGLINEIKNMINNKIMIIIKENGKLGGSCGWKNFRGQFKMAD